MKKCDVCGNVSKDDVTVCISCGSTSFSVTISESIKRIYD